MSATCGGCPSKWTGLNMAHCSACHETFSTVGWFDTHRPEKSGKNACVPPAMMAYGDGHRLAGRQMMKLNKNGVWVGDFPAEKMEWAGLVG